MQLPSRIQIVLKYVVVVSVVQAALWALSFVIDIDTSETGPFELLQAAILLLTTIAFLLAALSARGAVLSPGRAHVSFLIFMTCLAFIFLMREMSWGRVYGVPVATADMAKTIGVGAVLLVLLALAGHWMTRVSGRMDWIRTFIASRAFLMLSMAGALILIGDFFEKGFLPISRNQLFEESFELWGFVFMLGAALVVRSPERNRT